jgi:hypothetical protein
MTMQAIHLRLAAALTLAIAAIPTTGSALARPLASPAPVRPVSAKRPALHMANLLLRTDDVPGLVTDPHASVGLSLWDSSERDARTRALLRETGWRGGAERTFGQQPFSLYGVLVIYSRVLVFASTDGARRALARIAPAGLDRVSGRLPLGGGAGVYAHMDTVSGVSELALATQFRQRNVVSRVMIVGTPGIITRAHLLLTAQRQAMRVAEALPEKRHAAPPPLSVGQ